MTIRRLSLPTPTDDRSQQREFLRTTKEILEIAQRQRGDPMMSFVRLGELVTLGLADSKGLLLRGPLVFSDATRPAAGAFAIGTYIWNTGDNAPNFSDGANWRDAAGTIT